jgi:hypothetical protein
MQIYLVIAREGEYSDQKCWIVQAFLDDEAAAVEEAARLNVERLRVRSVYDAYWVRRHEMSDAMAKVYLAAEGRSPHYSAFLHLSSAQRDEVESRIMTELGEVEDPMADDYTVIAVPVGEHGRWDLP